jgi:2,3-bisphosphoglycerate-dependent phosphoglycerate mutase
MTGLRVVYETHSTSEDNERGIATGWNGGRLSPLGRRQARELGARRRGGGFDAVYTSDLARAVETARLAFRDSGIPVLLDWRLRECDYGELNGMPRARLEAERLRRIDEPWPGGESWRAAVERVDGFLDELTLECRHTNVLVVGHVATRWALDRRVHGAPLEQLACEPFEWRPGWDYVLDP